MGFTYQTRKKAAETNTHAAETPISKSEMLHLSGAGAPQAMSPALREKFEPSFNADFSNIRISRGRIPDELGVQAVAKGTDILLDSRAGMDVLGHELAHVVQQAQGQVQGGFPVVENAALEHQADVMGARAASGLSAGYGGGEAMSIAPMTSANAPAQCKSKAEKSMDKEDKRYKKEMATLDKTMPLSGAEGIADFKAKDARKKAADLHRDNMLNIVNTMSEKDLHNKKVQQRVVSTASSAVNNLIRKREAGSTPMNWFSYSEAFRGREAEADQMPMNAMIMRLLGRENIQNAIRSGDDEEARTANLLPIISDNDDVMDMLGDFDAQAFDQVDGSILDEDSRNVAIMNNFANRAIGPTAYPTKAEIAQGAKADKDLIGKTQALTRHFSTEDTERGSYTKENSPNARSFLGLASIARRRRAQRGNR